MFKDLQLFKFLSQFVNEISPRRLALTGVSVACVVLVLSLYISYFLKKDMVVLYSDLDNESSNAVITELEKQGVAYEVLAGGSIIKVPESRVVKLRVSLAQSDAISKGSLIGYEIFDQEDSISTTSFSQNIKMIRALEGELSNTISGFNQIDSARVHLVLPQKEIFSKDKADPRASIVLKLKQNKTLSKSEVDAIGHLVLTSVPGLDIKNITIVDIKGKPFKLGLNDDSDELTSLQNDEYRLAYEQRTKQTIEDLLSISLGYGKVVAQVSAEMNFDKIVSSSEIYDPDSAVARSVQSVDEKEVTPVRNEDNSDMSVANNIPSGMASNGQNPNFSIIEKSDQVTNYEISKTIKNYISDSNNVIRLSIGIMVDGMYKLNEETGVNEYIPRSKEELDRIANLVKVAVGFSEERNDQIDVVSMPFVINDSFEDESRDNIVDWLKEELPNLLQTVVLGIIVVLIIITVIRPIALKAFEHKKYSGSQSKLDTDLANQLSPEFRASAGSLGAQDHILFDRNNDSEKIHEQARHYSNKLNDLVLVNPENVLNILRQWLNEGK
ncbi:MAG: flagellar basal-body MS-ring/collar protein FliF [Rickettsiaceae bacterium]